MKTFLAVVQMLPTLITLIKQIEEVVPTSGQGTAKLALVREIVEASYTNMMEIWPLVEKAVAALVTFFNATGLFKKA